MTQPSSKHQTEESTFLTGSEPVSEFQILLNQYGDAMEKVAKLEIQLADLISRLNDGTCVGGERQSAADQLDSSVPNGPDESEGSNVTTSDLSQVKLQIANLSATVSSHQVEIDELRGVRKHRRKRGRDKRWPLWRRVAKNLGLPTK